MQTLYFTSDRLVRRTSNVVNFCRYKADRNQNHGTAVEQEIQSERENFTGKQKNRLRSVQDAADLAATICIAGFLFVFSICFFIL